MRKHPQIVIGVLLIALFICIAITAPLLAPNDPNATNLALKNAPPSAEYPLGCDQMGRCELSRLIYGARYSLSLTVPVLIVLAAIALFIGCYTSYKGGLIDEVIRLLCDIFMAFPLLVIAMSLVSVINNSVASIITAIGISMSAWFLRMARSYPDTYEVAFEDVTFAYDNTDHPAVSHLTFMAKAGAITALVGHSGSGKSTAASLIPRFYDVQDGAVKIGGVDIREIPQGDLMKMVAFVFQDPKLFKDSLLENIRAGRPSATREEVLKAAHLAQCDDILKKLPNGIDTIIGSQGIYLSGGETQRISIARAILKDAPIVVLDEATAYADPENEHQIQKAFDGLIKNKTVIMVAHRLSTVQDADQILVMKNGAIAESGTHSDLIKHQGEYAKMWDNYNKTVQWHIES